MIGGENKNAIHEYFSANLMYTKKYFILFYFIHSNSCYFYLAWLLLIWADVVVVAAASFLTLCFI
jgi:hypothetical protein